MSRAKINSAMVCPHCQMPGQVKVRKIAPVAFLTGGISLLATGLSRKQKVTEATCGNCGSRWYF